MNETINWKEWSDKTFERAEKENKLIFLNLYGSWCYLSKKTDKDIYSKKEIIKKINKNTIAIKVNVDKRPDIFLRYNFSGIPTSVFLNYKGNVITGSSYLSENDFAIMLDFVVDNYRKNKDVKLLDNEFERKRRIFNIEEQVSKFELKESIIQDVIKVILNNFDSENGGFGGREKYLLYEVIDFLIDSYERERDKRYLNIIESCLNNFTKIFDNVEGGFFRCSVSKDWSDPRYEKLLDINSGMLKNYFRAYKITKEDKYFNIGNKLIGYIRNNLLSGDGCFYGSQESDIEYYKLNLSDRHTTTKPKIDKTIYSDWNAMMISSLAYCYKVNGNLKTLTLSKNAMDFLVRRLISQTNGVYHYYDCEKKIYGLLKDNAYVIRALLDSYESTKERKYLEKAIELIDFVLERFLDKNKGFKDSFNIGIGKLGIANKILNDNCIMIDNLLRTYGFKRDKNYLDIVENTLKYLTGQYKFYGVESAVYAGVLRKYFRIMR